MTQRQPETLNARIDAYFAALGQGVNAHSLARARLGRIIALDRMPDRDLRRLGLKREDILAHVFRDILAA